MNRLPRPILFAILAAYAVGLALLGGCAADARQQAAAGAGRIQRAAGSIEQDAGEIRRLTAEALAVPAVPELVVRALEKIDDCAADIETTAPAIAADAAKLQGLVDRMADDGQWRAWLRRLALAGVIAMGLSLAVWWWTEKFSYAAGVAISGAGLLAAAMVAGWVTSHPYWTFGGLAALVAGWVALDLWRNPTDGWASWIWTPKGAD